MHPFAVRTQEGCPSRQVRKSHLPGPKGTGLDTLHAIVHEITLSPVFFVQIFGTEGYPATLLLILVNHATHYSPAVDYQVD